MPTVPSKKYWFPAKRYGWGWGLPTCWQGALVVIIWMAAFFFGVHHFVSQHHDTENIVFTVAMATVLIAICYWKGEPPRWRWGGD